MMLIEQIAKNKAIELYENFEVYKEKGIDMFCAYLNKSNDYGLLLYCKDKKVYIKFDNTYQIIKGSTILKEGIFTKLKEIL